MSISEKANDLLNKFCGAQYDYVVWSTQDNLVARDKARQEISDYIAKIETENVELKERAAMLDVSSVFKSLSEMSYIEQVAGLEAEYSALPARIAELEALVEELKPYRDGYDGEFLEPTDDRFYLIRHTSGQLVTWRKVDNHEDINFLGWGAKGKPRRYWRLPEVQE